MAYEYVVDRWDQIWFASWQHFSLVVQCLVLAVVIAVGLAALVHRVPALSALANGVSAVGLTLPSFAVIGLLIAPVGFGVLPSVIVVTFFATLPILRNAVVGLSEVDGAVLESARGIGMGPLRTFLQVQLPLAWPIILTGVRVSAQMVMGIAAVTAYALGPGLGGFIFSGLSRLGGANALASVVTGVVGVVLLALVLDLLLVGLGRLTVSRGIHVQN
ncbi:osmoprotectant transport system permease protein [Frigoribacterium sp. PhB160]|jgi:osmoprotectant transport system permease protein|uniref:ABC transporter permease n=1 Tax=Frigoribacterium sp. PhB160 TaxID=2485192 RepID=UPI000F46B124|nr:ABC transporter permease [Frigoribacterium sp. PhB160]ROS62434.1 osmoprotectant transport system permease protein [Frigoribacterium sp. PhB160]